MKITAFELAERFIGIKEVAGTTDNPQIVAMLRLDASWAIHDEVPWCSAFVNYVTWLLRLPRSKSLAARSWLLVGRSIPPVEAKVGFDICVFKRGTDHGPEVIQAPGHVGFFAGFEDEAVLVLGGNQGNSVSVARYSRASLLAVRRLREEGESS